MATMKIKKGDTVKVITGKDKDKEGKVIAVNRKNNTLLVEGENIQNQVWQISRAVLYIRKDRLMRQT